jgi:sterol desaturase/sphingolipid hydroxylase (fatty acid hydroxylase superfamily)
MVERILFLIITMFVLYGLEAVIPLVRHQKTSKRRAVSNIVMIIITLLVYLGLSTGIAWTALNVANRNLGILNWLGIVNEWAVTIAGIFLLDYFAAYLPHLLMHKIPLLWRLHTVHHSDKAVDITTSLRQHPFESLWRVLFQGIAIALLGVPLYVFVLYQAISGLWAMMEHANIKIPDKLDKAMQLLFVTSNMHKLHHSELQKETDTNYGNIFSIWDRAFHTLSTRTNYDSVKYGLADFPRADYSVKEMLIDFPTHKLTYKDNT